MSKLFGLRQGDAKTGTSTDTVGRWVAATEGAAEASAVSGRMVHGRYRLIAELGAGGMGVTYRAWDTQAGIPVVVKMPKREVRHDKEVMVRFAREIEAMRAVPHESIVPITDSGDDEGCPFVVMRFLPGGSLADYRRWDEAGNPIKNPPGMLHFWLPGVAAALDHIHSKGMLHRDVKPGNVFLDGFLKPFLGDFGIAKVVDDSGGLAKEQTLTATKMAVGTPEYMASELFKPRAKVDGRVDQYALAVTVYEMLCGEKPFTGSTAHIIVEHSSLPVPPLERRCPGLPKSVYDAVHRALAKKPEERFATCGEFAGAVLGGISTLTPEADTARLVCPTCRNILKLPQKAAAKSGRCPRCQAAMVVAADLGSLWLDSEEHGDVRLMPAAERSEQLQDSFLRLEKPRSRYVAFAVALFTFLLQSVGGFFVLKTTASLPLFLLWAFAFGVVFMCSLFSVNVIGVIAISNYCLKLHRIGSARVFAMLFEDIQYIVVWKQSGFGDSTETVFRAVLNPPYKEEPFRLVVNVPPARFRRLLEERGVVVREANDWFEFMYPDG